MPIDIKHLRTDFIQVTHRITLQNVAQALGRLPKGVRMGWYVVVKLASGDFAVLHPAELIAVVDAQGQDILAWPLDQIPELLVPSESVDRQEMGFGQAKQERQVSSKRRLVVLENGQPIGLLTDELLGGIFGGSWTDMFSSSDSSEQIDLDIRYTCPKCKLTYSFGDLIDLKTNRLICPKDGCIVPEED